MDEDAGNGSLRDRIAAEERERRLRTENLDGLYASRSSGSGNSASHRIEGDDNSVQSAGRDINNLFAAEGVRARTPRLLVGEARRIRAGLAETDSIKALVEELAEQPIVFVRGNAGSGRQTAALAALIRSLGPDELSRIAESGPDDEQARVPVGRLLLAVDPVELKQEDLDEGVGYVLDATQDAWAWRPGEGVPAHLQDLAVHAGCRIIVLVAPDCPLAGGYVDHQAPRPEMVFRRHLEYECASQHLATPADWVERTAGHEHVVAALGEDCPPAVAVDLALAVIRGRRRGLSLEESLTDVPSMLLREVRARLKGEQILRKRCFLAATAVLNGLPVVTVSRAALVLAELVESETPGDEPADGSVSPTWEQLGEWMDYAQAAPVSAERGGDGRQVRLRRPALAEAILEVMWEEHPTVREPLLAWLRFLSGHQDQAVRIKAAHAVGRLATFNFEVIHTEFLRHWTSSGRVRQHWLAAWAMEAAAPHPEVSELVRAQLRRWARGSRAQRSAAARAYGSSIGAEWIGEALDAFETIVRNPREFPLQAAVARSVTDIYQRGTEEEILRRLAGWAGGDYPGLRRTAALTLIRLATRPAGDTARPGLTDLPVHENADLRRQLVLLWRNALSCGVVARTTTPLQGATTHESWEVLADWIVLWERWPQLRPVIDQIFTLEESWTHLGPPLRLHLRLWFGGRKVPGHLCAHLSRLLERS